jgi:signal transduction histidine kinase
MVMSVADTGIGISAEEQGRIFDEFYQVSTTQQAEYSGTGLGLSICKRLVEMHDGVIWVRSAPESGSTFFVALPLPRDARTLPSRLMAEASPLAADRSKS